MNVLVCGGAGYIGSHVCVELLNAGYDVIVIDDFSNSKPEVLGYIKEITGKEVKFYEFNILNEAKTESVLLVPYGLVVSPNLQSSVIGTTSGSP